MDPISAASLRDPSVISGEDSAGSLSQTTYETSDPGDKPFKHKTRQIQGRTGWPEEKKNFKMETEKILMS